MLADFLVYVLNFVTCKSIFISDYLTFTFEWIPEDDPRQDQNMSDQHINIVM
jgi:hypothetical protein